MPARARARLAGLLIGALAGPAGAGDAPETAFPPTAFPPTARFSEVRVDVRPLLAKGSGPQAEALAADLTEALRTSFAGRLGGRGPALVVVVAGLSLRPYVGSGGGRLGLGGGGQTDYLEGEALLVGRGGQVLGRHRQMTATPSSSGGAWYDPQFEARRLAAITETYARWLARDLPRD